MTPPPDSRREVERLALLHELQLPAAALVPGLEAIARMAARVADCPIGAVSIVDETRQWLHAASGSRLVEQPRAISFSAHALDGDDVFEVPDIRLDARFEGHPLLSNVPPTLFFAGMPIRVEGQAIGTVSVIDRRPGRLDERARAGLRDLATMAAALFEARLRELRQHAAEERARAASRAGSDWLWESDSDGVLIWVSDSVQDHTGWPPSAEIGAHSLSVNRPPPGELRVSWDRHRAARARHEPFREGIAERDTAHGPMLVALSGEPVFDAAGSFRGYRGAARDVTAEIAERARSQRSQQLLLQAIEAVRAGVMISGPDGRVLVSNASWQRNIGPFGDVTADTWEDFLRAMVRQGVYPDAVGREEEFIRWRLSLATPEARLHELRFGPQDALISDQLLPDGSVIHLSLDITEHKRVERELIRQRAELVESQARMAAVLRAVPDLWFVIDTDNRYLLCSDDHHPWLVRPFDELRGRAFEQMLPGALAAQGATVVRRARESGELQLMDYVLTTPDGVQRSFEARISPMPGGQVLCLTRDLTERVRDAERLRISEDLYRSVAATINDGLLVVGPAGEIIAANPSACDILALDAASLTGRRLDDLGYRLHDEHDRPLGDAHPVLQVLRGGTGVRDAAHLLHRPDGRTRLVQLSVWPLHSHAHGRPRSSLVTFSDITAQRATEQALRDKQAIELASRAKTEFLSRMSHEMRTPLNAVIGFTQLLRLQPDSGAAKVAEYTDHVLRAGEHLLSLVNEVLDLQRVEEGRLELHREPVQLEPLVAAAIELVGPMALRQNVALTQQVPADAWVHADRRSLRQVLVNLISNAVKYNRAGGWVCVSLLDAPPDRTVLGIEDTGSGLSDDQIARLFQPFERLGHESSDIEGSGLGLVIARSLVGEMGGELTLASVKNAGTLARIELPACEAPNTLPAALVEIALHPAPASAPPQRPALRLLYVEDNRINALLFEEAMRLLGDFELRVAEDGADALSVVRDWTPQVLVLDANLPDMSGFEVLRRMRELPALADVPAYMCSADAMPEDLRRARDAGFQGYWTKPIEMAVVSADLESWRARFN